MHYEYHDFSKNDKKKLVALMAVGAKREIEQFLKKSLLKNQGIVLKTMKVLENLIVHYMNNLRVSLNN